MIWHVAHKEVLSTLRDRRALVSNLLIPFLVLPLVMLGLPFLLSGLFQREAETVSAIGVEGLAHLPGELRQLLEAQNLALVEIEDPLAAVERGDYLAALAVPAGLAETLSRREPASLTLYSKRGNLRSELVASKVQAAIGAYRSQLVAARLAEVGLDPAVLEPLAVETHDASSPAEQATGQLGWLIPFFIVIWTLAGGQMTAIDATAGEKERGTLEVLLVAPIRRSEVVLGKFLATLVFGLSAAIMAILGYLAGGMVLSGLFAGRLGDEALELVQVMGGSLNVSVGGIAMLIITALLVAALMAALLIGITMFARSFKEAQSYVAPLSIILIIPVIGLQFADFFAISAPVYLVPILGPLLAMDGIIKATATPLVLALTWGSSLAYSALLLAFAYRNFRREDVLFRT